MNHQRPTDLLEIPIHVDHLARPAVAAPDPDLETVLATGTAREAATLAFGLHAATRPVLRALAASLRGGQPGDPVDLFPLTLGMALAPRLDADRLAACLEAADSDAIMRTGLLANERDVLARATAATGPRRLVRLARTFVSDDRHRVELPNDVCPVLAALHPLPAFNVATPHQLHRAACAIWGVQYGAHRPLHGGQAALAGLHGRPLDRTTYLLVPNTVAEFDRAAIELNNCLWRYPPEVSHPAQQRGVLLVVRHERLVAAVDVANRDMLDIRGPTNCDVPERLRYQVTEAVLAAAGPRTPPQAWSPPLSTPQQPPLW